MFTALGSLFSELIAGVLQALASIFKWIREHPKEFGLLVLGCVLIVATYFATSHYTEKKVRAELDAVIVKLQTEVNKANADAKARNEKIARIEKESKESADELEAELLASKKRTSDTIKDYEQKLKLEKGKTTTIYVPLPGKDNEEVEVALNDKNQVVCQRLPDAFVEQVNVIVKEVNTPIKLKFAKELPK